MTGCPAGLSLRGQGRGNMPVRGCSCPYRDSHQVTCNRPAVTIPTPLKIPGHCCNNAPHWLTAHPKANTLRLQILLMVTFALIQPEWGHKEAQGLWCFLATERVPPDKGEIVYYMGFKKREGGFQKQHLQAHALATTVSSVTTDGNVTQSRSRDMPPVSTLENREADAQNCRLHWLHPAAALLT